MIAGLVMQSGVVWPGYAVTFYAKAPGYISGPPDKENAAAIVRWLHDASDEATIQIEFDQLGHWYAIGKRQPDMA